MDTSVSINPINIIEERKEAERDFNQYVWKSCCFNLDKRVVIFSSQFVITLMIISFSLYQLSTDNSCEHQQFYSSLITMLVGVYLPSPRLHK